ncbi:MAG: type VI secretion system tip protein VgrG [Polyangiaceae bacterium]|nr:type VI secretion system tip protein VgrG [Polyangiaceae bacterium]
MTVECSFATADPGLEHAVTAVEIIGEQRLSALFRFDVQLVGDHAEFGLEAHAGARARIRLADGEFARCIDDIVTRVCCRSGTTRSIPTIFTVEPELTVLTQRHTHPIFQHQTTREVVDQVLAQAEIHADRVDWDPAVRQPVREYSVQYHESDFDFVCRLLEEDGISFFFRHPGDEAPIGSERLVFVESAAGCRHLEGGGELEYHEESHLRDDEHIHRLQLASSMLPNESMVRDFNFHTPALRGIEGHSLAVDESPATHRERRIYAYPGRYQTQEQGLRLATRRLEAHRSRYVVAEGDTNSIRLDPGALLEVSNHPRGDFNQEYLILGTTLHARPAEAGEGTFIHRFEAIPSFIRVRPPLATPKPRVHGSQTAFVVGPPGEEIHTDELGRIKIQFHWDRQGHDDEHSSCWVRVAQSWAGTGFGAMIIPRVGMEVVVSFLEGDPDRPLVTGCVYNATHLPPHPLPQHKTRSIFRTHSTPDGGAGYNELTFEDANGAELVFLHAERDLSERIEHDHSRVVLHDEKSEVGNSSKTIVSGAHSIQSGSTSISTGSYSLSAQSSTESVKTTISVSAGDKITQESTNHFVKAGGFWAELKSVFQIVAPTLHAFCKDVLLKGSASVKVQGSKITLEGGDITIKGGAIKIEGSTVEINGTPVKINC